MRIEVIKGDITKQEVHAIVNAAHEGLCGGGGVDGAIHQAAGTEMTGECMNLPINKNGERCPIGECRMTSGYKLPALYIIHTVGPVWTGKDALKAASQLIQCYMKCLFMAKMQGLHSIAFPCISTGAFAFPKDVAAKIAVNTVSDQPTDFVSCDRLELVRFVCFDGENYQEYLKLIPGGSKEV